MALLIFHSSCIGYVLSLARMGLFHGTFKLRLEIAVDGDQPLIVVVHAEQELDVIVRMGPQDL